VDVLVLFSGYFAIHTDSMKENRREKGKERECHETNFNSCRPHECPSSMCCPQHLLDNSLPLSWHENMRFLRL